ncbi:MAG TPA: glycosyl hydrolase family 65 protein [Solirubrobacteraceae bacterium]
MIAQPHFAVEPWSVTEEELDLDVLAQAESVLALSNGHIGLRANLDEGEPFGLPGTYLNAFYEVRPLPYAEAGYGYPEDGQTVVNVTNGKIIRLLVDDAPFDVRYGELLAHRRTLDLRAGVLRREVHWRSPAGREVKVRSLRFVSFVQRPVAGIRYEVEPLDGDTRIVVQSGLIANEDIPAQSDDPRAAAALRAPLVCEWHGHFEQRAVLVHSTKASGLRMAAAMDHEIGGPDGTVTETESFEDIARVTVSAEVGHGETLTVTKYLAYGWSSQRTMVSVRDQVGAALASARRTGFDGLLDEQRAYLDDYWARADVEIDGDDELQQAVRFALFHTLQAGARAEQRAIAAKGLTGSGYDGHVFWDTETYVLPMLTYTVPEAARDALAWRHSTLDLARERASQLHLRGAAFPWRTIRGHECSAYWPAGTAAFHINADIADAVMRYLRATVDEDFGRGAGLELLVATARLWHSLGHHDARGTFHIDCVTGPDEYSAICNDNVYTNLMAARNLTGAADACNRFPREAAALDVDDEEIASWRDAAAAVAVPYNEELGVHEQCEGFTRYERWNFAATQPDDYPLMLHFAYGDLYRKQVVKQADLVLALLMCGDSFTAEEKARDFTYYEALTVRDSSLSACVQAVVAAEVGQLELAFDYFGEAALMDLDDLEHNTRDGLHIASLAGSWVAAVVGFGGFRDHGGTMSFDPRLPPHLERLAFRLVLRGRRVRVEVVPGEARYELLDGDPIELRHVDAEFTLESGTPQAFAWKAPKAGPVPEQPARRAPSRRRPRGSG